MNRRVNAISLLIALTLFVGAAQAAPKVNLTAMWLQGEELQTPVGATASEEALEVPQRDLRIHVWHGREDDDPYNKSELLELWFRTNEDAYVVVYRIYTEGFVEVLWPSSRFDDGFVYGGHSYSLTSPESGRRLRTSEVKGVEYVEAIASRYPFDLRELGIDFAYDDARGETFAYQVAGDPFLAVNDINYAITGLDKDVDYVVTDWTHLYVEEQVEYARYTCRQCHVDESEYYHPYVDTCTQVSVRYDYGWHSSWYLSFGWYPIYYDPLYVYWDYWWYRPYYYWYYPICYSWPSYYWGSWSYCRTYPVYGWYDSDYYYGDYRTRYRDGAVKTRPLYPTVRGDGTSRVRDVARRDLGSRDSVTRGRDGDLPNNRGPQIASARNGRASELTPTRSRSEIGRSSSRTIRTDRAVSSNSGRRVVSQTPVGRERGSVTRSASENRSQRRWTRPVVRNVDGADRSDGRSRATPSETTRRIWDRAARGSDRDAPNADDRRSRGSSEDRSRPDVRDRKDDAPKDQSGGQRTLRSRNVRSSSAPAARRDATVARSPRSDSRSGAVTPRSSSSRSSGSPTVRSNRGSSDSRPAPSSSGSSVRSRSSSSSKSTPSRSSVRSRGSSSSSSRSSASASRGRSRSSGSRGGSSRSGGRGRG